MDRGDVDQTGGVNGFAMKDYSNEEFQEKQNGIARVSTRPDGEQEASTDQEMKAETKGKGKNDREYPPLNSAFVTFSHPTTAHKALDVLHNHETYRSRQVLHCLSVPSLFS